MPLTLLACSDSISGNRGQSFRSRLAFASYLVIIDPHRGGVPDVPRRSNVEDFRTCGDN